MPKEPAEKELPIVENIELFAARLTLLAWKWSNLDPWQRELLKTQERYVICCATRQGGKSATLAVKAFHQMVLHENSLVLFVAEQRQSNEDLRKVKELGRAYDKYLRKRYGGALTCGLVSDNITSIELANGSRAIALPGNEKVRGYSAPDMVVMDEAAYTDDEVFIAIDPMMEVGKGQLILASTPAGTGGFFAKEWNNPRYTTRFRVPWTECPRISPESIQEKRMLYGDPYVRQEYECTFNDELIALFSEKELQASVDEEEEVFEAELSGINKELHGEIELV
jgi:hypothetical protein